MILRRQRVFARAKRIFFQRGGECPRYAQRYNEVVSSAAAAARGRSAYFRGQQACVRGVIRPNEARCLRCERRREFKREVFRQEMSIINGSVLLIEGEEEAVQQTHNRREFHGPAQQSSNVCPRGDRRRGVKRRVA